MAEVFLSYAQADSSVASLVRSELEKAGIKTWSDRDIQSDENWEKKINEALKQAAMGVVLLSPAALNSAWVTQEYQYLLSQNKPLYVALVQKTDPGDIPLSLQRIQWVDLSRDVDSGIAALKATLQNRIHSSGEALSARRRKPRVTVTFELDSPETEVAEFVSKIQHLLESDSQHIRVINIDEEESASDVYGHSGTPAAVDEAS